MKYDKLYLIIIAALMLCQGVDAQRVMSYNIRNGRGMDEVTDYRRVAEVIIRQAPDIVALQEVDSFTNRSAQTDVLQRLAEETLMHRVYAPAIPFDGGKYGVGMLSKEKPLRHYHVSLPGREEERVLLVVEFAKLVVGCTHLSLTEADRLASVPILRREAAKASKPFILMGDLNDTPDSPFMKELSEGFILLSDTCKATHPSPQPKECIDYIAVYKPGAGALTPLSYQVINEPLASDHRPIQAEIRLKAAKEAIFYNRPYLQNPVDGGITVMWQTTVPTYSWVEYGTDTTRLSKAHTLVDGQVICNSLHNKIRLNGLQVGQQYYYRVCSREITLYRAYKKEFGETATSPFYTFTLPSESSTDFTALVFNDLHKQEATLNALMEQVKDVAYDFVVFNGDCIDDPANEAEALFHLRMQCQRVGAERVPVFYLRGNHEIRNAYSIGLRELLDYVGDKTYGAFNWGDTRFVMLDCGEDKPDSTWVYYGLNDFTQLRLDQVDFLREELSGKPFKRAKRRVLLNHIPLYGASDKYSPCRELWGPLLAKAPFDLNISAHTHRFAHHPKGETGNNFPVVIGGSQRPETATVMILKKRGDTLSLQVLNGKGEKVYPPINPPAP
ncbi:endonuclease/exonuclease/phosphatase family metal-dependent hydrolase [Parabacteroides sp. PF5-5]|nr:endonuclease/exonuclease/phosphatase family metal-dependent hydrolase [Parabacteroides sp. PF5-13]MDH6326759.1 endonuclease/exonuclease/phosphatase family metal-dependent hydrolase [Parabacteroides sp. PH5-41]MDH6334812.1 endonuclease/exonuclease/phosphatase family metal-dependent hydrolase [Parabacteroides sp. PF5-5]MDH6345876.1 endonuclease/exonuclease/phosphatase family metal-dependent hydrolase [Parabacteroides sp. PH5-46]MDH6360832.1 endonuclease/exonuclease/phosphatase family metal-dep